MKTLEQNTKLIWVFVLAYFVIVGVLPSLMYHSVFMDSAENLAWSQVFSWGYKHPPLGAWLLNITWVLFHQREWAVFTASALCLCVSLFYVYRLSACFMDKSTALFATLLASLSYFFMVNFALQYNQNTIMLPFWVMSAYYFWRSIDQNKLIDWLVLGLVGALAMLAKYQSAILLIALAGYLACHFKQCYLSRICVSFVVFLLVCLPHIIWVYHAQFLTGDYFSDTTWTQPRSFFYMHLVQPLIAFVDQLSKLVLPLVLFWVYKRNQPAVMERLAKRFNYMTYLAIAPLCLVMLFSAISGVKIKSEWGFPLLIFLMPALCLYGEFSVKTSWRLVASIIGVHFAWLIVYTLVVFSGHHNLHAANNPSYQLAKVAKQYWQQYRGDTPLRYAGGDTRPGMFLAAYLPSRPHYLSHLSFAQSPWLSASKVARAGILLAYKGCQTVTLNDELTMAGLRVQHQQCVHLKLANKFQAVPIDMTLVIAGQ